MKIVYKPIEEPMNNYFMGYTPIVVKTELCCDSMARSMNNTIIIVNDLIRLKSSSPDTIACGTDCSLRLYIKKGYMISFCPFCGEKVEIFRQGKYLENATEKPDPQWNEGDKIPKEIKLGE